MHGAGYEFNFTTSRASLWLAFLGALLSVAVGTSLVAAPFAFLGPGIPADLGVRGMILGGAAVVALAMIVLRRALMQAHECRVGDAGVFVRTLLRQETFIPWQTLVAAYFKRRLVRFIYVGRSGRMSEFWLQAPGGKGGAMLRFETFVKGRLTARRREA